jgi:hypothetical protein
MKQHFFAPKLLVPVLLVLALSTPVQVFANASEASSNASGMLSIGAGSMVAGSVGLLAAGGQFVVESVEKTVDGTVFVISNMSQDLSKAGKISVRVSGNASGTASVVAGQSVQLVAESAGTVIMASGEIIAFIPNEIGQSLMHHSSVN